MQVMHNPLLDAISSGSSANISGVSTDSATTSTTRLQHREKPVDLVGKDNWTRCESKLSSSSSACDQGRIEKHELSGSELFEKLMAERESYLDEVIQDRV